jgi:hypothetical protein
MIEGRTGTDIRCETHSSGCPVDPRTASSSTATGVSDNRGGREGVLSERDKELGEEKGARGQDGGRGGEEVRKALPKFA